MIKSAIKKAYSSTLWHTGALALWLRVRPGRSCPWILSYHHIEPEAFESHLESLVRRYRIATLDACLEHVLGRKPLPPNSVVITFDDGYEQVYHELYPLLEKFNAPATIFAATAPVDTRQPLWFNRVKTFLRTVQAHSVRLGELMIPLEADRETAYVAAMRRLNSQPIADRDRLVADLIGGAELPADRMERYRTLTWDQMRAMRGLVTFGAHTRTHPCLSRLSRAEAEDEIAGSKKRLEEMLDVPVRHFAYPFGGRATYTAETIEVLKAAGLESAATTSRGTCRAGSPPYDLPRILFDGSVDGRVVAARLSGLWCFLST